MYHPTREPCKVCCSAGAFRENVLHFQFTCGIFRMIENSVCIHSVTLGVILACGARVPWGSGFLDLGCWIERSSLTVSRYGSMVGNQALCGQWPHGTCHSEIGCLGILRGIAAQYRYHRTIYAIGVRSVLFQTQQIWKRFAFTAVLPVRPVWLNKVIQFTSIIIITVSSLLQPESENWDQFSTGYGCIFELQLCQQYWSIIISPNRI